MRTALLTFLNLMIWVQPILSQDTISGYYTYQTGATERIGQCLDLRPNHTFTLSSIRYYAISQIDSGLWSSSADTVIFKTQDSIFFLQSASDYNLLTFLPDTVDPNSPIAFLIPTHWTKTRSYYENGQIKTTMSWTSISRHQHEFIPHGLWITYYENGNLKEVGKYKNGRKKGKWFYVWPNGSEKYN